MHLCIFQITATCNISNSSQPDSTLIFTYETLRAISQSTSQYCITKLSETLTQPETCEQFDNFSYIMDIMCQQVRQNYCTSEWRLLELNSTISERLIDCSEDTGSIDCGDQFGLAYNDSVCLPLCSEFSQYSETITTALFAIGIFSHITNIIGGMAVLITAFNKRQKMYVTLHKLACQLTSYVAYLQASFPTSIDCDKCCHHDYCWYVTI